jgi:hypothetical protein
MLVEGPLFELINSGLVNELRSVDSHHSHHTLLINWLVVDDVDLLFHTVVFFIANGVHLGVAGDKLNEQVFTKPVSELQSRWLIEVISESEIALSYLCLSIHLEVVNPGFLFGFDNLISAVLEP